MDEWKIASRPEEDFKVQLSRLHISGPVVGYEESKEVLQNRDQMLLERLYLLGKLFILPISHLFEVEWQRRNDATTTISYYCPTVEGGPLLRGRRKEAAPRDGFDEEQTNILPEPTENRCSPLKPSPQDIHIS